MNPAEILGIDITDWIVVAFTGLLVVLNGFLVFFNSQLHQATKAAADAALQQAISVQRTLEIVHQPFLRPVNWRAKFLAQKTVQIRCDIGNMRDVPTALTKVYVRAWCEGPPPKFCRYNHPYLDTGVFLFGNERLEDIRARVQVDDPIQRMISVDVRIAYWNRAAGCEEERLFSVGAFLGDGGQWEFTERPPDATVSERGEAAAEDAE